MSNTVTQRKVTRNQSTADYEIKRIFVFDNRFENGIYKNNAETDADLVAGMLVARDLTVDGGLIPVTASNLADVVGISAYEGTVTLAENETAVTAYATKGTIDGNKLVLPATVTLNTDVGNKSLKDVLEAIGFHIDTSSVEHTKFDN
jgi:propanediol dehydratase large subunit